MCRSSSSRRIAGNHSGFSLLEVMIASLLAVAVLMAAGTAYVVTDRSFSNGSAKMVAQQEAALLARAVSRAVREGNSTRIYLVPNRERSVARGNGISVFDEAGDELARFEWSEQKKTMIDRSGNAVTSMILGLVEFETTARPGVVKIRFSTYDKKGNYVDMETAAVGRN